MEKGRTPSSFGVCIHLYIYIYIYIYVICNFVVWYRKFKLKIFIPSRLTFCFLHFFLCWSDTNGRKHTQGAGQEDAEEPFVWGTKRDDQNHAVWTARLSVRLILLIIKLLNLCKLEAISAICGARNFEFWVGKLNWMGQPVRSSRSACRLLMQMLGKRRENFLFSKNRRCLDQLSNYAHLIRHNWCCVYLSAYCVVLVFYA
jgi:hypothetical protein